MSLPSSIGFCNFCGQERTAGLYKCSRCYGALYCDRDHQKSDWPRHRLICSDRLEENQVESAGHTNSLTVPAGLRKSSSQRSLQLLESSVKTSVKSEVPHGPVQPVFYVVTNPDLLPPHSTAKLTNFPNVTVSPTMGKFSTSWSDSTLFGATGSLQQRHSLREVSSFPTRITYPAKFSHNDNVPLALPSLLNESEATETNAIRVRTAARHVAQSLLRYGWSTLDNFLGENHSDRVLAEVAKLYDAGTFADGQLMRFREGSSTKRIRSDKIRWWDGRKEDGPAIQFLISMMDAVIVSCSHALAHYRINGRSRAMIACYPGSGTHYVTHVDNPDRDGRCITAIYYLNTNWRPEDGGSLKIYAESATDPVEIPPLFDRLLLFWSDRRNPHEVMPVFRNRFAVTVWYYDAIEKAAALEREGHELNLKNVVEKRFNNNFVGPQSSQPTAKRHQLSAQIPLAVAQTPTDPLSHTSVIQHNHEGICPLETVVATIKTEKSSSDMER